LLDTFKILIVIDKFKGSLTSSQACLAIKKGIEKRCVDLFPSCNLSIEVLPMADGGEGTLEVIEKNVGGIKHYASVSDPLYREIKVPFLLKNKTAFIEMALCSGLQLLTKDEYNPMITSTFGLGELILEAVRRGAEDIVVGIGGSATNDGGMGMLKALGYEFFDRRGDEALSLNEVYEISDFNVSQSLHKVKFTVACDVTNPLLGDKGASIIYAPQKGATPEMVEKLEIGMRNYAEICERFTGRCCRDYPGSGAAGGIGFAFKLFFDAEIIPGWIILSRLTNMEKLISTADLVITGEGSLDKQSVSGKLVYGVCMTGIKYNKTIWAFCGINHLNVNELSNLGISKVFEIITVARDIDDSIKNASYYLEQMAFNAISFLSSRP
jgi:glycerate kinase